MRVCPLASVSCDMLRRAACPPLFCLADISTWLTSNDLSDIVERISQDIVESGALDTAVGVCPSMLNGVLWVARHYDFLPGTSRPMAAAACPAIAVSAVLAGAVPFCPRLLAMDVHTTRNWLNCTLKLQWPCMTHMTDMLMLWRTKQPTGQAC